MQEILLAFSKIDYTNPPTSIGSCPDEFELIVPYPYDFLRYMEIVQRHNPNFYKWINFYANGDAFSGPIHRSILLTDFLIVLPSLRLIYYTPESEEIFVDRKVDNIDPLTGTILYHSITSLDARGLEGEYDTKEGYWKKYVKDKGKLDLARYFRARVRCDIISVIDPDAFCSEFDTNFNEVIDLNELTYAIELERAGEIKEEDLLEAIEIWKYGSDGSHDADSDGFPSDIDCFDYDPDVYPGAPELCDGIDNQCPGDSGYGTVDEGCPPINKIAFVSNRDGNHEIYTMDIDGTDQKKYYE